MTSNTIMVLYILIVGIITQALRYSPFFMFGKKERVPKFVLFLSKALPPAIMIILVIYNIRNIYPLSYPSFLPEILSLGLVFAMQFLKKNAALSITLGTALYMILIRAI